MAALILKPPAWRRAVDLPSTQDGFQELWETPSDPRARGAEGSSPGIRAWAVVEASWSPSLHQFSPVLRRLYTRTTGDVREIYPRGDRLIANGMASPGAGPEDRESRDRCLSLMRAALPLLITDPTATTLLALGARKIFIPEDVLA